MSAHQIAGQGRSQIRALLLMGPALAGLVAATLKHAGYDTQAVSESRLAEALRRSPDVALIDADQSESALSELRRIAPALPVVAFTRRRGTAAKVHLFERGADDIVEMPFALEDIVVRPYALLRRTRGVTPAIAPRVRLHHLEIDLLGQTVTLDGGKRLDLTPIQQTLLYVLAANSGNVLTRETLLATIWGNDAQIESNVVDRHIRELRVKLGDDWRSAKYIETIAGKGYRFKVTQSEA